MAMTFIVAAKAALSSPSVRLYQAGADVLLNAGGDTLVPGSNGTGQYTATITETLSGSIYYEVLSGGLIYRNGFFKAVDGATNYAGEITTSDIAAIQAGLSTLGAADIRTAIGLATANLDTQLDTLDSILADTGTDGVVLSAAQMNKIADHTRRRTQANVEASSDGDALSVGSLYGFIQQAQEASVSGVTLTIKKTDGTTTLGTKAITVDAAADPMTGIS